MMSSLTTAAMRSTTSASAAVHVKIMIRTGVINSLKTFTDFLPVCNLLRCFFSLYTGLFFYNGLGSQFFEPVRKGRFFIPASEHGDDVLFAGGKISYSGSISVRNFNDMVAISAFHHG